MLGSKHTTSVVLRALLSRQESFVAFVFEKQAHREPAAAASVISTVRGFALPLPRRCTVGGGVWGVTGTQSA